MFIKGHTSLQTGITVYSIRIIIHNDLSNFQSGMIIGPHQMRHGISEIEIKFGFS